MIEIAQEQLIALSAVPDLLPCGSNGKKTHVSTVYRWVARGVRGIRLEATYIGGSAYTSREAIQRFCDALTNKRGGLPERPSSSTRRCQQEAAEREADARGM